MTKSRFKPSNEEQPSDFNTLPTSKQIAVYYRQSTKEQIGNTSTSIQQIDLPQYISRLGWQDEDIVLIDDDEGVSGATTIDERVGMSRLFRMIVNREIGAVAVQDEDRLFRDDTQIQPNVFLDACKKAQVWLITPSMQYCFHGPMGSYHADMFRQKAKFSADFLKAYVFDRMQRGKNWLVNQGVWAGNGTTPGYLLTPENRFVPWKPWADVIVKHFELLAQYQGNARATAKHIMEHGPYYPDPTDPDVLASIPVGYRPMIPPHLKIRGGGYAPSNAALQNMASNAMYLGHWMFKGKIIKRDNHPPIVDETLFMEVFNYMSAFDFDGNPNPHYTPHETRVVNPKKPRTQLEPLCKGLIYTEVEPDSWRRAHLAWNTKGEYYLYQLSTGGLHDRVIWEKKAIFIDEWVVEQLKERLTGDLARSVAQAIEASMKDLGTERRSLNAQLASVARKKATVVRSLSKVTDDDMIKEAERDYKAYKDEERRLKEKLAAIEDETAHQKEIMGLKNTLDNLGERWPKLTYEQQVLTVKMCVSRILVYLDAPDDLTVTICWQDDQFTDTITLSRRKGLEGWLSLTVNSLIEAIESGKTQTEIARIVPDKTWKAIASKYFYETGKRFTIRPKPIKDDETYNEYTKRVEAQWTESQNQDSLKDSLLQSHSPVRSPMCQVRCCSTLSLCFSPTFCIHQLALLA